MNIQQRLNTLLAIAVSFFAVSAASAEQMIEPIVAYEFNAPEEIEIVPSTGSDAEASLVLQNGATYSAKGDGVSGEASDHALDLTDSPGMGVAPGGIATRRITQSLSGLSSFTLTGWFKTADSTPINAAARLFDGGSSFFLGGADRGNLVLGVNGENAYSAGNQFGTTQEWVFFAVTDDGTKEQKNVKFYIGTIDTPASLVGNAIDLSVGSLGKVGVLNLGNREFNDFDRSFHGLLDDMKIFGSVGSSNGALDLAQIQKVQKQSLNPSH